MKQEMLRWLSGKLAAAEKALECRKQGAEVWRDGDDNSWKAVGCSLTKKRRLELAAMEDRIAIKCLRDVEMFKATIAAISK